jgi:hypothetical protein
LLDENLRDACGLDRVTGGVIDEERAQLIGEVRYDAIKSGEEVQEVVRRETIEDLNIHNPTSFIESLL